MGVLIKSGRLRFRPRTDDVKAIQSRDRVSNHERWRTRGHAEMLHRAEV